MAGSRCTPEGKGFAGHIRLCFAYLPVEQLVAGVGRLADATLGLLRAEGNRQVAAM